MKSWILGALALFLLIAALTARESFTTSMNGDDPRLQVAVTPTCSSGFAPHPSRSGVCVSPPRPGTCPTSHPSENEIGKCYTRSNPSPSEVPLESVCPAGLEKIDGLCMTRGPPPTCPARTTLQEVRIQNIPGGRPPVTVSLCFPSSGGGSPPPSAGPPAVGGGSQPTSGGTMMGGTPSGPPTGGSNRRKQVFGPIEKGRADGDGVVPMDSSKTNRYPELLGGRDAPPSTSTPSRDGLLPSSAGLGSDENSKFLPFSRQPGDMDLIPDPYRVSQQFSAANYSFKTEPVPFLTDFSAFQK